jgi:L-ribulose-5-phosphate 3-epimerase
MKRKIGIMIESLKLGIKPGIVRAAELGVDGFQVYVTEGETAPENMSADDRQAFKKFIADHGLEISALCGDMGKGFLDPKTSPDVVRRSKLFIDLAVDLGTKIVTTHIGHLPEDEHTREWEVGLETAATLGAYASERGCVLASETGPEAPTVLKRFLEKAGTKGIGVNYDPANFIMLGPFDHIGGVEVLAPWIVHTHAKDGICLMKAEGGKTNRYLEVPLGEGGVAFKYYLAALDRVGYTGYLTIEREVGDDPESDVMRAVDFLRSMA